MFEPLIPNATPFADPFAGLVPMIGNWVSTPFEKRKGLEPKLVVPVSKSELAPTARPEAESPSMALHASPEVVVPGRCPTLVRTYVACAAQKEAQTIRQPMKGARFNFPLYLTSVSTPETMFAF